jgi:hypothetical protein
MARGRAASAIATIKIRMKEPLRAQIERAAKRRGVSMNQEMNDRLTASFARDQALADNFGSREIFGLAHAIAAAMNHTGRFTAFFKTGSPEAGDTWWTNAYAYNQAAESAARVIDAFKPPGDPSPPTFAESKGEPTAISNMAELARRYGEMSARALVLTLKLAREGRDGLGDWEQLAHDLNEEMGPLAEQMGKERAG